MRDDNGEVSGYDSGSVSPPPPKVKQDLRMLEGGVRLLVSHVTSS